MTLAIVTCAAIVIAVVIYRAYQRPKQVWKELDEQRSDLDEGKRRSEDG